MRLEFASGADRLAGELIAPKSGLPAPGVVIVHDVWGLSAQYQLVAQRFADAGYVALAVDLYARGEQPGTPADMPAVLRFMETLPDRRVLEDLDAAIETLARRPEVAPRKIGLTGYCMGGKYAFLAAAHCRGLSAALPWYGMLRARQIDAANPEHALEVTPRVPLLALFGADDALIPERDVELLRARAKAAEQPFEIVVYPGAGHAFANDSRPEAFRPEAAADGWRRALAFFARTLN